VNLLIFNLRTDIADTALGFTTSWINALAQRCERVVVVTLYAGVIDVAPNVRVYALGPSAHASRARRLNNFYRLVRRILRTSSIDACFAHMTPHLATLFWPFSKLYRIPVLLWYAHGAVPLSLRIAHPLVDRCITSTPAGFQLNSNKLFVLGQGIDTRTFSPPTHISGEYERTALTVGRITPRKHLHEIIESLALLRHSTADVRLIVVGEPVAESDRRYAADVRSRARRLGVDGLVDFVGAVPFRHVHHVYRHGTIFLNASDTGSLDKAILEGMASGCIPISRNRSFAAIARAEGLDFLVPPGGADGIADSVREVLALSAAEKVSLRRHLRRIVVERHSLDSLMDEIRRHLGQIAADGHASR
jgi:glycosyltransferase involved in cell wall biosynthesis